MTCAEFEILLCDYVDGTLEAARRQELESHRDRCPACAELARDVAGALSFIERSAEVDAPPELLARIAFEIPTGRPHVKRPGFLAGLASWFRPMLQPRFTMGMAMTILSFSLLGRVTGVEMRQLKPADLQPTAVWAAVEDKAGQTWARVVRYYEGLKIVYEVQTRLRELRQQEEEEGRGEPQTPAAGQKPAQNSTTDGKAKQ